MGGIVLSKPGSKGKYEMPNLFTQFDGDGDGKLDIYELARAFRALGLTKRDGEKSDMDKAMFKSFDVNGDGYVSMKELDSTMPDKLRAKIDGKIDLGWKFDPEAWNASVKRHNKWDMKVVFADFDADGDGKLDIYELARAFRALGLPKRDGSKMDMDKGASASLDPHPPPLPVRVPCPLTESLIGTLSPPQPCLSPLTPTATDTSAWRSSTQI